MFADSQFQMKALYPGNFDRCRRCGAPRKMHGADGSCHVSLGSGYRAQLLAVAGAVTALAGSIWLLASDSTITAGSAVAFALLVLMTVAATGVALAGRRR
jgi:hypothetical protein